MIIYIKDHEFHYEIECLCRIFFPNEKFVVYKGNIDNLNEEYIFTQVIDTDSYKILRVKVKIGKAIRESESRINNDMEDLDRECERELSVLLYKILSEITDICPPWGILTGIRPIKLFRNVVKEKGFEGARQHFKNKFLVSDEKLSLTIKTETEEEKILNLSKKESFSLYISIPFCPSRCSYCSFVSQSIEKAQRLIPEYIVNLCREIKYTAEIAKRLNLRLETVYVGGGTPTILSAEQLKMVISEIRSDFNLKFLREFTVEAGRPDTITKEKLDVLREMNIDRISINPQTLNDDVLKNIGRKHSALQTIESYKLAREVGFSNINMDLIVGLPGDNLESFKSSLKNVCALNPENITVHTLCMKKASTITEQGKILQAQEAVEAKKMMRFAEETLELKGYIPYYLYRQSRMIGNLENVGWAKPSKQGLYNVYVMDETHTILACGASAVSKLKDYNSQRIERIFNYKFPYEYIQNFEEMIKRKNKVVEFYEKL